VVFRLSFAFRNIAPPQNPSRLECTLRQANAIFNPNTNL
jgi:hypothetical protein